MKLANRWYLVSIVLSIGSVAACVMGGREEDRETWHKVTDKKADDGTATDGQ